MTYFQVFQYFEKMESEDRSDRLVGIVGFPDSRGIKAIPFLKLLSVNDFTLT
jgi:hypothetical protein